MSEECTHDCSSCSANCEARDKKSFLEKLNEHSSVKHIIGIVSGKGGVGKSLVTSSLAVMFNRKGYKTAILDADITGPSIPKAFGIKGKLIGSDKGLEPATSETGIEIISANLIRCFLSMRIRGLRRFTSFIWQGESENRISAPFWT